MIYLIGHIVFASAFTLCLKWVQIRGRENIVVVGAINYLTAAVLIFPEFFSLTNSAPIDPAAVLTGASMGACYFAAYFFIVYLIKWVGAASSTVVGSLSILIPIAVAAVLWNEIPNIWQWIGISLAIASLSLIGIAKPSPGISKPGLVQKDDHSVGQQHAKKVILILVGFFAIAGSSRLAQRAFGHLSQEVYRPTFLFSAFAVAGAASLAMLFSQRRLPSRGEFSVGVGLGSANILHTHFLMRALDQQPGYLVFPISSAGGLAFTTLIATQLMGERTSRQTLLGIGMAVIALVLLNA